RIIKKKTVFSASVAVFPEMRFWVAQNKTVPVEVLEVLARDDDPRVRSMVARKGKASSTILTALAKDPESHIRAMAAGHKSTPRSVLEALASTDPSPHVRNRARERLTPPQ
ncbi:MAG: HEAT repeat domain-containing protein, partial [Salinibacterium sp.]|nr:HEAT repeat domain-containing protein [Salinibacterium sp.]